MNEFKMSLFLAPISPVKDGGTGQIIKPATLKPYKTMTLQEVYRTITANTRLQLLTDRVRRAFDSGDLSAYRALKQELLPYVTPCGTFGRRRSDSLLEASGLVVWTSTTSTPLTKPPGCAANCLKTRFLGRSWSSSAPADRA